jgi:raffinose/stachyose/melibiose transport system permease protein
MKIDIKWATLFLLPAILLFLFIYAVPIGMLFSTSFTDWTIAGGTEAANFIGLSNYIEMVKQSEFLDAIINTLIWIILGATLHVLIGLVFALIIMKNRWYHKTAKIIFLIPNIISSAAIGILFLNIFNPMFGPVNNLIQVLGNPDFNHNWFMSNSTAFLSVTLMWLPFGGVVAILMLAAFFAIPREIIESAIIDGASQSKINLWIIVPMSRVMIGTCSILAATAMLQQLGILLLTTNGAPGSQTYNLPLLIYKTGFLTNNLGLANAQGVLLVLIGLFSVILLNRIYRMNDAV